MPGETFYPGEHKPLPGVYVRVVNVGPAALPVTRQGVVATLLQSSWGPMNTPTDCVSVGEVVARFGAWGGADLAAEVLYGGARIARVVRVGTTAPGTAASLVLVDTGAGTPANVLTLNAKYVGARPNAGVEDWTVSVRDSLTATTPTPMRELVLYAGATVLETWTFAKGATAGGEAKALQDAIAASDSRWLAPATSYVVGNGTLKSETNKPFAGGGDPTASAGDYATALAQIEKQSFNMVCVDQNDPVVHASVKGFVDRLVLSGIYPIGVVGEPSSVNMQTRLGNAKILNDANMIYVGNGFSLADGTEHEGYRAAGRVAGLVAGAPYTDAITNLTVPGSVAIVGEMTVSELSTAKLNGMLTLRYSAAGFPVVTQGINTLVVPASNQDDGWKKIRRVRQRYNLIERCVLATDPMVGRVSNDAVGQVMVMNAIRGVLGGMVAEGALRSDPAPSCEIDEALQAFAGPDESFFIIAFVDNDSMEYVYQTFGTSLTAPATSAAA